MLDKQIELFNKAYTAQIEADRKRQEAIDSLSSDQKKKFRVMLELNACPSLILAALKESCNDI